MRRVPLVLLLSALALALPTAAFAEDPGLTLERHYGVVTDHAMNARLNAVGARITAAVQKEYPRFRDRALSFKILRYYELNAMAVPDGRIYVTSGMMQALAKRPDDELAAVLGHEATHVAQRHSANQKRKAIIGAVLGGVVLGRAVGGASAIGQGAQFGAGLNGARYSRDDEYRADAGSVQLLRTAGYDPYAVGRLLKLLQDREGPAPAALSAVGWFDSHPDTAKRVENADRVADQITGRRR